MLLIANSSYCYYYIVIYCYIYYIYNNIVIISKLITNSLLMVCNTTRYTKNKKEYNVIQLGKENAFEYIYIHKCLEPGLKKCISNC